MVDPKLNGFLCYQVGGSVRDRLLGIEKTDRDWVVIGEKPDSLLARGFQQVGADFPVFLHPLTKEEYALARTERKIGPGYRGFAVLADSSVTLEADLIRRDLTINAMAIDSDGRLIDPFGGQKDLKDRILRHTSSAFSEDPLRVLRVARFMARFEHLGFSIAPETLDLMAQICQSNALQELSVERIWMETHKALSASRPSQFFMVLQQCGALATIFPELSALLGQSQPPHHHPEGDAWAHSLQSLEAAVILSQTAEVRLAALLHDLGKGETAAPLLPHHHGHEEAGVTQVIRLCKRLKIPNSFEKLAVIAARHHMHCHQIESLRPHRIVKLLRQLDGFRNPPLIDDFILVCTADKWGRGEAARHQPYRAGGLLKKCLMACQQIDNQSLIAAGFQGRVFGEMLHKRRIKAVQGALTEKTDRARPDHPLNSSVTGS
ncbi:MAG: multifunctional CCA addition/repair protein [Magnetococcales bacterium]|nr:multifunctional CCA addition/repair protein [Magnetococcales bacterium]